MGSAWGDFDNDGFMDMYTGYHFSCFMQRDNQSYARPTVFMNRRAPGGRAFVPILLDELIHTKTTLCTDYPCLTLASPADFHSSSWMDYDGDGDEDLLITTGGGVGKGSSPHLLLRNEGGKHFSVVSRPFQPHDLIVFQRGRNHYWNDFNNDGLLDLFIAGLLRDEPDVDHMIFVQTKDKRFSLANREALHLKSLHTDKMWLVDRGAIYAGFGHETSLLLFKEPEHEFGMRVRVWEDPDRELHYNIKRDIHTDDECVAHCAEWYSGNPHYCCLRVSQMQPKSHGISSDALGHLQYMIKRQTPSAKHQIACALPGDFDNDGIVDLILVYQHDTRRSGPGALESLDKCVVYFAYDPRLQKYTSFRYPALFDGLEGQMSKNPDTCAIVDYNNDGLLDVAVSTAPFMWYMDEAKLLDINKVVEKGNVDPSKWYFNHGFPRLLQNKATSNMAYIKIVVTGGYGITTYPLGTRVRVQYKSLRQEQVVSDNLLFYSQNDKRLHFGLGPRAQDGDAQERIMITVIWPDGVLSEHNVLNVNCLARISRSLVQDGAEPDGAQITVPCDAF